MEYQRMHKWIYGHISQLTEQMTIRRLKRLKEDATCVCVYVCVLPAEVLDKNSFPGGFSMGRDAMVAASVEFRERLRPTANAVGKDCGAPESTTVYTASSQAKLNIS